MKIPAKLDSHAALLELASALVEKTRSLGADEASAAVGTTTSTGVQRRDGRVEQAMQSTSRGLSFSVLIDGRFSSHGTSDLRPEALELFLHRAISATRLLEPDLARGLPEPVRCGRGATEEELDLFDLDFPTRTAEQRGQESQTLEAIANAQDISNKISLSTSVSDGVSNSARVTSNGFSDSHQEAWYMRGVEVSFIDGPKRPESAVYYGGRYLSDIPSFEHIAAELAQRVEERRGAKPIASGEYPFVLSNRVAGKILGVLAAPLSGSSLHEQRSCMVGKLGERIGSPLFSLYDDPLIPRGLGSRPWDGEGVRAKQFPIIERGILQNYYINTYFSRKLGIEPTTGGRSNWVIPPGDTSWKAIVANVPQAILIEGFLGGNSNPSTGDFSFGIRGALFEYGVRTQALSEMNISGNAMEIFQKLIAVGDDPYLYSSTIVPTLIFDKVQFSGA